MPIFGNYKDTLLIQHGEFNQLKAISTEEKGKFSFSTLNYWDKNQYHSSRKIEFYLLFPKYQQAYIDIWVVSSSLWNSGLEKVDNVTKKILVR